MGKRIPGKKRKGYLDLCARHSKRQLIESRFCNNPPKDINDQPIDRNMHMVTKLIRLTKEGYFDKKLTEEEITEMLIDERYRRAPAIEEITCTFRNKMQRRFTENEMDENEQSTNKTSEVKTKPTTTEKLLTKKEKKKSQIIKKKIKIDISDEEIEEFTVDRVQFGETVHAPPSIKAFPKNANKSKKSSQLILSNKLNTSQPKLENSNFMKLKQEQLRQKVVDIYKRVKAERRTKI